MPVTKDYNYEIGKYEGRCRFCGKSVIGRVTKKFCNDKCRTNYRNEINSIKKKFSITKETEAHNYFLLMGHISKREYPVSVQRVELIDLSINGFDFNICYIRYKEKEKDKIWFNSGNLYFRIIPSTGKMKVQHAWQFQKDELEYLEENSLRNVHPEFNLKGFYTGNL